MQPANKEAKHKKKPSKNSKSSQDSENSVNKTLDARSLDSSKSFESVFLPLNYSFLEPFNALEKMAEETLGCFVIKEKIKIYSLIKEAFEGDCGSDGCD